MCATSAERLLMMIISNMFDPCSPAGLTQIMSQIISLFQLFCDPVCPGGNVCQPCGSKGKNPRRAQTLAGGRLGPCHQTKTGGEKKQQHRPQTTKAFAHLSFDTLWRFSSSNRDYKCLKFTSLSAFAVCCWQLFHLPAKKSVETVLEDYANYKKSKGNSDNK